MNVTAQETTVLDVFRRCVAAIRDGKLIQRETRQDKEFHFQDWLRGRLKETGLHHEVDGRNAYPDFRMVEHTEGYEVKGLAYPGREVNYDCNSQAPSGSHNGRTIFYVFGRYPAKPDGDAYPVVDLVICHGDFLNADHEYVHRNRSIKGFGSSDETGLSDRSVDVVVTDPPFFDNVHYSELADFFYAWQGLYPHGVIHGQDTTRHAREVQDTRPEQFADKLCRVFAECRRVLKDDGLLAFTYHHSRPEGWTSLAATAALPPARPPPCGGP